MTAPVPTTAPPGSTQDQARQTFLARAGETLAGSLDYATTLRAVAALAVQDFADACLIDILNEDGSAERLAVDHRDPALREKLEKLMAYPVQPARDPLSFQAMAAGQPKLIATVTDEELIEIAQDERHLALLRAMAPRSLILAPLVAREKLLGLLLLVSDGPDRVFSGEDLRLADELARRAALAVDNARLYANAQNAITARDQMLAVVSHDLRNPLGVVMMAASFLRELVPAENPQVKRQLDMIDRSAQQMNRMIEDLLDVARVDAGRLSVEPAPASPASLISEAVDLLRPLADDAGITLVAECDGALPRVLADRARVLQVFSNLGGNAVKFTPRGGRITLGATVDGETVRFHVADSGLGMPAEHLSHLFDRFWQASRNDRRGIGLGLAIVQGIVTQHGGRVWAESAPGEGSTFHFTLPLAPPAA
ncbi:sensor histidine kinase [Longimicrobium terrae]|uniref:histidine kinase n=1 Tax=Longimicrobium terrae TaxID=1639882 RepID=A0A841H1S0_9BACT|nr:HAMP domain-containing sensor histidine kinase [Longimicrobium terrae]MBB4637535.1 signal transduction histidine kinase [Longimicrobium terrae]MBB6071932.1 signal transduction histidine kinase [Longimicrobium terrae]NNC30479.1 HAMP domain-containing histidine kinase [Longimicrobium terrae]